jgi:hypothetical protein
MNPLYELLKTPEADRVAGKPLLLGEKKQARLSVGPRGVLLERTPVDPSVPDPTPSGFQPSALMEPYLDKAGGMVGLSSSNLALIAMSYGRFFSGAF